MSHDQKQKISSAFFTYTANHGLMCSLIAKGIDWNNPESVRNFRNVHDAAAKSYNKMTNEEQGQFAESFNDYLIHNNRYF